MDGQRRPSEAWISSSESEDESEANEPEILATTPYSKITALRSAAIAKKRLYAGHHPPHYPRRELAIHELLKEIQLRESSDVSRNVIPLLSFDVFSNGQIALDFPLMETDLKDVYLERKEEIAKDGALRSLMIQRFLEILSALQWIHELGIIHRDVNPSNILLSRDLEEPAYLADFGVSWIDEYPDNKEEKILKYSSGVGTGPYRAPELIFSPKDYAGEVDIWSFGCTVAELFTPKYTLFSDGAEDGGLSSDLVLLSSIISALGTPTTETWPETESFRDWDKIQLNVKNPLPREEIAPWASPEIISWIFSMVVISASRRADAASAVQLGETLLSTKVEFDITM